MVTAGVRPLTFQEFGDRTRTSSKAYKAWLYIPWARYSSDSSDQASASVGVYFSRSTRDDMASADRPIDFRSATRRFAIGYGNS